MYLKIRHLKELDRIDGRIHYIGKSRMGILNEIQKIMAELRCELEQFKGSIIFVSMYNDIIWKTPENLENCGEFQECCSICQQVPARILVKKWC